MAYRAAVVPGNGTGWVSVSGTGEFAQRGEGTGVAAAGVSAGGALRAEAYEPEGTSGNWKALGENVRRMKEKLC